MKPGLRDLPERILTESSILYFDNNASRFIAEKPGTSSSKSKAFEVEFHWIRSKLRDGLFQFRKINSELNRADLLTKFKSAAWFKSSVSQVVSSVSPT